MKAKKHFGQHFLIDEEITKSIADKIIYETAGSNIVYEIGPGSGNLTKYLIENSSLKEKLQLIEVDPDMVKVLNNSFSLDPSQLVNADFLEYAIPRDLDKVSFVGNLPYNIASQIFFKILEMRERVDIVIAMIQKEVADRLVSPPKRKSYGIPSVIFQTYFDIEHLFHIGPNAFSPPPKVDSTVIMMRPKRGLELPCQDKTLRRTVKIAFAQRRKTLRNNFKSSLISSDILSDESFNRRAEEVSPQGFIELAVMLGGLMRS